MEINRVVPPEPGHTLGRMPRGVTDIQLSHTRSIEFGRIEIGVGESRTEEMRTGATDPDVSCYSRWSSQ